MTVKRMTMADVAACIKTFTELGGIYTVDDDGTIRASDDSQPVVIPTKTKNSKMLPIRIASDHMTTGDWVYLNPFESTITPSSERRWFLQSRSVLLGWMTKVVLSKLAAVVVDEEVDTPMVVAALASKLSEQYDAKYVAFIEKLINDDFIELEFDVSTRRVTFKSRILDPTWREGASVVKRARKKDITLVEETMQGIFGDLLGSSIEGTTLGCIETDATLKMITALVEKLAPFTKAVLDIELPVDELKEHTSKIAAYHEAMRWFVTPVKTAPVQDKLMPAWQPRIATPVAPTAPKLPAATLPNSTAPASVPKPHSAPIQLPPATAAQQSFPLPSVPPPPTWNPAMQGMPQGYGMGMYGPPTIGAAGIPVYGAMPGMMPGGMPGMMPGGYPQGGIPIYGAPMGGAPQPPYGFFNQRPFPW